MSKENNETEKLAAENANLRAEVERLKSKLSESAAAVDFPEEVKALVREKLAAGLSREQALEVAKAQVAWDLEQTKKTKK